MVYAHNSQGRLCCRFLLLLFLFDLLIYADSFSRGFVGLSRFVVLMQMDFHAFVELNYCSLMSNDRLMFHVHFHRLL